MKAATRMILFLIVLTVILPVVSYAQNLPRTTNQAIELSATHLLSLQNPDGSIGDSSSSDWAAMALAAAGTNDSRFTNLKTYITAQAARVDKNSATELERTILALTAIGANPYTIQNRNLVDELKALGTAGQIGSPNFLNDDIFAILAFRATGQDPSTEPFKSVIDFVKRNQLPSGGFNDRVGAQEADIDITAVAIVALNPYSNVASARNFLISAQNPDGGFPSRVGSSSNVASTAWALWAIGAKERATQYLINQQQPNGSFGSMLLTSYSLHALTGRSLPVGFVNAPVIQQSASREQPPFDLRQTPAAIVQPTAVPAASTPPTPTPTPTQKPDVQPVITPGVRQPVTSGKQSKTTPTTPAKQKQPTQKRIDQPLATPVASPNPKLLLIAGSYPKATLAQTNVEPKTLEPPQLNQPKSGLGNVIAIILPFAVITLANTLAIVLIWRRLSLSTPTGLTAPRSAPF